MSQVAIRLAQPLPELPPVASIPQHSLPNVIRSFMEDVADRISCPQDFVAVGAIAALSAVIGRKRMLRGKLHDDWVIVPNVWGMIIGPPSAMKSPALRAALSPLDGLETKLAESYNVALCEHDLELRLKKMQAYDQERSAKTALKSGDMVAARSLLSGSQLLDEPPARQRLVVNDVTVEKLQELLSSNQNGLLMVRDELGGLIARLESEDFAEHRSFLLVAHNGRAKFVVDRIGRGTIILPAVCVSILGCVQPSRISKLVKGAVGGFTDDGLLQRFQLTVWPDPVGQWKWKDKKPCAVAVGAYEAMFAALHQLEHLDEPLSLAQDAYEQFMRWHIGMREEVDRLDLAPALAAHLLKSPEAVLSLALIFQLCADAHSMCVESEAMRMAIEWAAYLRSHADRLYHSQSAPEVEAARRILRLKESLSSPFSARDIYRKNRQGLSREEVAGALLLLVDYGHLYEVDVISGGRPSRCYQWTN